MQNTNSHTVVDQRLVESKSICLNSSNNLLNCHWTLLLLWIFHCFLICFHFCCYILLFAKESSPKSRSTNHKRTAYTQIWTFYRSHFTCSVFFLWGDCVCIRFRTGQFPVQKEQKKWKKYIKIGYLDEWLVDRRFHTENNQIQEIATRPRSRLISFRLFCDTVPLARELNCFIYESK